MAMAVLCLAVRQMAPALAASLPGTTWVAPCGPGAAASTFYEVAVTVCPNGTGMFFHRGHRDLQPRPAGDSARPMAIRQSYSFVRSGSALSPKWSIGRRAIGKVALM